MKDLSLLHKTITLTEYSKDITSSERAFINAEKKYYRIVIALKNKREALGLTQSDLAQLSKLPRTTITKIESGSRNATLQSLMTIAQAMGKQVELRLL